MEALNSYGWCVEMQATALLASKQWHTFQAQPDLRRRNDDEVECRTTVHHALRRRLRDVPP